MTREEAIKVIEKNLMNRSEDLREALSIAIEALKEWCDWIPCAEEMPVEHEWIGTKRFGTTKSDNVLVTIVDKRVIAGKMPEYMKDRVVICDCFFNGEINKMHILSDVPIAWKPMPKPYRENE